MSDVEESECIGSAGGAAGGAAGTGGAAGGAAGGGADTNGDMSLAPVVPPGLLGLAPRDDLETVAAMWGALPHISVIQGRVLAKLFSFEQFFALRELPEVPQYSGARLKRPAAESLRLFHACFLPHERVLGQVTGISQAMARTILGGGGLREVLRKTPAASRAGPASSSQSQSGRRPRRRPPRPAQRATRRRRCATRSRTM